MFSKRKLSTHALAGVLFSICFAVGTIRAQVTASVSGRVEDSSGAALPGATVTVTSLETGAGSTVSTGEAGTYRVLSLLGMKMDLTPFASVQSYSGNEQSNQ